MGYHAAEVEATDQEGGAGVETSNSRRQQRRSLFVEVQVQDHDELYIHKARNLSLGGMFLDAPLPLPPGTRLGLKFALPGVGSVAVEAEVRWNTDMAGEDTRVPHPGMGVVFAGVAPDKQALIAQFVDG